MHTNGSQSHCAQVALINKLIYLCSQTLGGLFHGNGTVLQYCSGDQAPASKYNRYVSLTERTHIRMRHRETARQKNLEAVLTRAARYGADSCLETLCLDKVDVDWAGLFFNCALDISNKTMQALLARALVSELAHPGSISKRSLHFIVNCDSWEIKAFRRIIAAAFLGESGHPFVFRSSCDSRKDDPLLPAAKLLPVCSAAGLIAAEPSALEFGFGFNHNGQHQIVRGGSQGATGVETYYIHRFTKIGSDIYSLLSPTYAMSQTNTMSRARTCQRLVWNHLNAYLTIEAIHNKAAQKMAL